MLFASIVTYNPDIGRLCENIKAIISQIHNIIVIDNGSDNIIEIQSLLEQFNSVSVILNKNN